MKMWKSFTDNIMRKPLFWVFIALTTSLSYFFDLANRTLGVDDLTRPLYNSNNTMLSSTRWGMKFWYSLLTSDVYVPFVDKFMSIIFLVFSGILFSRVFYPYISNNKYRLPLCTLFTCLYISYPLINEIWNYNGINAMVYGNAVIVSFTILTLCDNNKILSKKSIFCSLLLSIVVSSYESSAFLYVTVVFSILLLDYIVFDKKDWICKGISFAVPLILAIIIRYIIGFGIIRLLHLEYRANGATDIYWNSTQSILSQVIDCLKDTFHWYFLRGLIYLPIGIFVLSFILFTVFIVIFTIGKRKFLSLVLYFFLMISIFLQTIIQGTTMPYRTAQTIQFFCPFALTFCIYLLTLSQCHFRLLQAAMIISGYICYRQGVFLNQTLALNNQRSDNEASIAYNIGPRLKSNFDDKPVFFVGGITLGSNINNQIRPDEKSIGGYIYRKLSYHYGWNYEQEKIYDTDVNSVINWSVIDAQNMMADYMSYYGFDINVLGRIDAENFRRIVLYVIDEQMKPFEIRDMGSYILVFLGERTW